MKENKFVGTGVALVTPFDGNLQVDYTSLKNLVNDQINGGVDFLVILGTTGESVVLSKEEKEKVIACIVKENNNRVPLVLGIGSNNTSEVVEAIKNCPKEMDGILSVSPYYNKPSQEGIYQHFKQIAQATDKPIIVYNVPGRTASNIAPETVLRLANDFENIVAVKEAAGDMNQAMRLIENKPEGFAVLSGDDALTCPMTLMGGDGVISVQVMGAPVLFSEMVDFARQGNKEEALKRHYIQLNMMDFIFEEGNPVGIKSVLKSRGVITADLVRLPLIKASAPLEEKLQTELKRFDTFA
jgi:4-hydroxy-tetrahydrodipicolinate synthase